MMMMMMMMTMTMMMMMMMTVSGDGDDVPGSDDDGRAAGDDVTAALFLSLYILSSRSV